MRHGCIGFLGSEVELPRPTRMNVVGNRIRIHEFNAVALVDSHLLLVKLLVPLVLEVSPTPLTSPLSPGTQTNL